MRPQAGSIAKWIPRVRLRAMVYLNHHWVVWLLAAMLVASLACYSVWQLARLGVRGVGRLGAKILDEVRRVQVKNDGMDRMEAQILYGGCLESQVDFRKLGHWCLGHQTKHHHPGGNQREQTAPGSCQARVETTFGRFGQRTEEERKAEPW